MKIVVLQDRLRLGGTEAQALALGNLWLGLGHDVRLIVFRPGGDLAESPAAKRLQPVILQRREMWVDWWAPGLDKNITALAPDVVVAFGREANAKLARLKKLSPRPLLVATLRSGREQPARYWHALRGADAIVANAQWATAAAIAQGVAKEKLHTIYSGIIHEPLQGDPATVRADWRQRARTPDGAVVLLCVAGFRRGKGQDLLLNAAARLPTDRPWQIWFAGDGPFLKTCKKIALSLKLKEQVRFTGKIANPAQLYAAADVGVMASVAEALPNFLIEAQAAGLPVVSTVAGGTAECFEDGRTGLAVPSGEPAALAAALERAIRDADWRAAAKAPAQARVQERFDARRNAAKWIEL
ncbi:MAG TPA: glycosyltransferase, partial [Opitutales bacterium]|nr:glycosyltransferase [Opitutales bacterium]